ncbi:MAG: hypothetical protein M1492_15015 [Gammaproteobacteria bacterium]|nr:hypothetical protein [Gammaproteobacteria bacterium]
MSRLQFIAKTPTAMNRKIFQHQWRLAGHVENGRTTTTDPANTAPVLKV